jgi:hypothetical protein
MKVGKRPLTCALTMLAVVATLLIEPSRLQAEVSVDVDNEFPNVGVVMVWLLDDGGQPLELLTMASGTLVHERVIVTAGHFTAPVRDLGGLPPGIGVFASFSPTDARDPSTWIPVIDQITHPSIPFCPPPDFCDPTTADVFEPLQPGIADVGLVVLEQAPHDIEPAEFAHPNTLSGPHAPGTPTTIVGYGFTAPAPGGGPPGPLHMGRQAPGQDLDLRARRELHLGNLGRAEPRVLRGLRGRDLPRTPTVSREG